MLPTNLTVKGSRVDIAGRMGLHNVHFQLFRREESLLACLDGTDMIADIVVGSLDVSVELVLRREMSATRWL